MEDQTKKTRRTHEQATAHRRYRRMRWVSGSGEWLYLYRCTGSWSYRLFTDRVDAEHCSHQKCGDSCKGITEHRVWRVIPDEELEAVEQLKNRAKAETAKVDEDTLTFWESKMGVSGL